jgi:diaminopimelate epimerase
MELDLIKCHGSGNDFLLIDEISNAYTFSETDRATLARLLCNRETNLGADGILFVLKSNHAEARMRVFNTDGSEASMCGNGLRCVARYVCEMLEIEKATIETMKADLKVKRQADLYPEVSTYLVEISPVSFDTKDLPLNISKDKLVQEKIEGLSEDFAFTALAVPNPHLVSIVEKKQIQSDEQKNMSEYLNGPNELCPDGVNVSFVKVLKPGHIYVRTFERGVGFTNACGTAMSASTLVTCLSGVNQLEKVVNVYNNGGKVHCIAHENDGNYLIELIGNATYVYRASVKVKRDLSSFVILERDDYSEQDIYKNLQSDVQKFLDQWM